MQCPQVQTQTLRPFFRTVLYAGTCPGPLRNTWQDKLQALIQDQEVQSQTQGFATLPTKFFGQGPKKQSCAGPQFLPLGPLVPSGPPLEVPSILIGGIFLGLTSQTGSRPLLFSSPKGVVGLEGGFISFALGKVPHLLHHLIHLLSGTNDLGLIRLLLV